MKLSMPHIVGNKNLKARLCEDILSGKLAHAYIIEGAYGTGRHLLARSIAKALVCQRKNDSLSSLPCDTCPSCRRINSNNSTDVITVSRESDKASVGIDAARFIKSDIRIHPNDFEYKIYIIEEADKMTAQAQNALLLTLEEPPAYAVFFLICEQAEGLLETVRSRAPIIRTEPVEADEIESFLLSSAPEKYAMEAKRLKNSSPNELSEIIMASGGAIGRVLELLDAETRASVMDVRERVRSFVEAIINKANSASVIDAVFSLSNQKRETLASELELAVVALRDLIVLKKYEDAPLCFYSNREYALELSSTRPISTLFRLISICEETVSTVRKNANIKLALTSLISQM